MDFPLAQHDDAWSVIIRIVAEPRSDTSTVHLIWLMQASKDFERLVKKYFEQMCIKPFELLTYQPIITIYEDDMRYGVKVKSRNCIHNVYRMEYSVVHNRKVVMLTFVFDKDEQCINMNYIESCCTYCLMLSGNKLESIEKRTSYKSEMKTRHVVYFDNVGTVCDMFKNIGKSFALSDMSNVRLLPENPEYKVFLNEALKIYNFVNKWKDQSAKDLFGTTV